MASATLLEQPEMVVVDAAGDLQERGVRIPHLHLEAQDVAIEAHAPLDVRYPEDQVLESPEADSVRRHWETPTGRGRGRPERPGTLARGAVYGLMSCSCPSLLVTASGKRSAASRKAGRSGR